MTRLALLLLLALSAQAQEFRGTILGRVADPSGAPTAGTKVEVINADTGVNIGSVSNESGNFQIPFLVPGTYTVRVTQPGFKNIERTGVRVLTGAQITLDFILELGASTEKITVEATTPVLETASADLGTVIDRNQINNVTVNISRNVLYNLRLAPGITGGGGSITGNGAGAFSVAGSGSTQGRVEYMIDGIPNTTAHNNGGVVYIPSMDAVDEIKVHTTMFDAQYGHSNGGAINITTRSGTNELRGTAYLYKRWAAIDANSWQNNRQGLPKAPTNYRQYGYLVTGPVFIPKLYNGRNRTFFSTTLESDADPRELTRQARVPTALERNGDFSRTINRRGGAFTIYDPATTVVTGGRATRQPFAGNVIPAARQNATGVAWMKLFPNPVRDNSQLEAFNWVASGKYDVINRQTSARVDHHWSDRQRMFVRFGLLTRDQDADKLIQGQYSMPIDGGGSLERLIRKFWNLGMDDTFTFSPTFIGSFRYGFVRKETSTVRGAAGFDTAPLSLPSILASNQAVPGWPTLDIGGNLPVLGTDRSGEANDQHSFMATFTKLNGKHSLKWGADWRVLRWNRNSPGSAAPGTFAFNPVFTQADPFTPTSADVSGTGMASLLLGLPASGNFGANSALSLQNHYLGLFIQEDWKISPRLTINFGVRFELETPYTERYNRMSYGFDETARLPVSVPGLDPRGGILFAGIDSNPRRGGLVDGNNFGPRFGFAFSLNPKTVLRGGYGMFYSGQAFNTGFLADVGVFNAVTPFVGSIDNGATPFASFTNPFPTGLRTPLGASAGLMAQTGDAVSFFDGRRRSPYNQQWQFSIQREMPSQLLLEAAYVGMLSLKQFESFNLNEKPDIYLPFGTAENTRVPNPFLGSLPPTSVLGQGATVTQNRLWTRFPQFTNVTIQGVNTGKAVYHGLQLKADKRLTRGLSALWTYTYAKLLDNETTSIINPRRYRTVSQFDQEHVMRLAVTYELPWKFAGNKFLRQIAGGWSSSGYYVYETGLPLGITHVNGRPVRTRNAALSGAVNERLGDRVDPATRRVLNPYFDTTAFQPLANQFIVSPEPPRFDELRAPGSRSLNMSMFKSFPIRERIRMQLRLDAQGLTNTPNFAAPGTNMSSPATFGVINSAGGSRSMQGALRIYF